jgi:hypothetical protein
MIPLDIDLGMPEKPEEMLVEYWVTSANRIKE